MTTAIETGRVPSARGPSGPKSEQQFCRLFFILAILLCLPAIIFDVIPPHDVSERYAPMVHELASGNWGRAFMPRIQPLLVILSAPWAVLGLHSFTAVKLTSVILFAFGVFPLFYMSKIIFDAGVARWTVLAYVLCSKLLQYAGDGLRETGKCTFLLVVLFGLLAFRRNPGTWRYAAWVGFGAASMALIRGETLFYSIVALIVLCALDAYTGDRHTWRMPQRGLAAVLLFLLLISPWVAYQIRMTGYPVTDSRQAAIIYQAARQLAIPIPPPHFWSDEEDAMLMEQETGER